MERVVIFMILAIFEPAFDTINSHFPLILLIFRAIAKQTHLSIQRNRPTHINNNKLILPCLRRLYIKMEPNIITMRVDVVLDEKIEIIRFFVFENTVQIATLIV